MTDKDEIIKFQQGQTFLLQEETLMIRTLVTDGWIEVLPILSTSLYFAEIK